MSRAIRFAAFSFALSAGLSGCAGCESLSATKLSSEVSLSPQALVVQLYEGDEDEFRFRFENSGRAFFEIGAVEIENAENQNVALSFEEGAFAVPPGGVDFVIALEALSAGSFNSTLRFEGEEGAIEIPMAILVEAVPNCDDGNVCTLNTFDRELRACVNVDAEDGLVCDDNNACTENTRCSSGQCVGTPLSCVDDIECTVDTCNPEVGCEFVPVNARCDDGEPCTQDICGDNGCENPNEPPATVCELNGCESIGLCFFGACTLQDVPDGIPCEDGDLCTTDDTCQAGECTSGPRVDVGGAAPFEMHIGLQSYNPADARFDYAPEGGFNQTPVDEVLAIERHGLQAAKVIWRGRYQNEYGNECDPESSLAFSQTLDPDDSDNDGLEAEPVPPPLEPYCRAAVFMSQRDNDVVEHQLLATVDARVVAAFGEEQLIIATLTKEGNRLYVRTLNTLRDAAPIEDRVVAMNDEPHSELALSVKNGEIAVAVAPAFRPAQNSDSLCQDGDCQSCNICESDDECGEGQVCHTLSSERPQALIEKRCIDRQRGTCDEGLGYHVSLRLYYWESEGLIESRVALPERLTGDCFEGANRSLRLQDFSLEHLAGQGLALSTRTLFEGCPSLDPVIQEETLFYAEVINFEDNVMMQAITLDDDQWLIGSTQQQGKLSVVFQRSEENDAGNQVTRRGFETFSRERESLLSRSGLGPNPKVFAFVLEGQTRVAAIHNSGIELYSRDEAFYRDEDFLSYRTEQIVREDRTATVAVVTDPEGGLPDGPDWEPPSPFVSVQSFGCFDPRLEEVCSSDDECESGHCQTRCGLDPECVQNDEGVCEDPACNQGVCIDEDDHVLPF